MGYMDSTGWMASPGGLNIMMVQTSEPVIDQDMETTGYGR